MQEIIHELNGYCYGNFGSSTTNNNNTNNRNNNNESADDHTIKMLYITPEKFSKSEQLNRLLVKLAGNGLLSRFVIDEAHCLSQVRKNFVINGIVVYFSFNVVCHKDV